jgi:uncharacterized protein (UPF0548 family)
MGGTSLCRLRHYTGRGSDRGRRDRGRQPSGRLAILAIPCRIVYCSDEPNRFGFAYGTLLGHPERGEEAFHVVRGPDDSVTAHIVAFSRAVLAFAYRRVNSRTSAAVREGS